MASFFKPPRFLMRERASARTVIPESRTVTCYRCAKTLTVSGYAESASCPHCAGNLRLLPIHVTKGHWGSSIMTTESVVVDPKAKLISNLVIASGDILIEGVVEAMCICGGNARITPTGVLKGGIRTKRLIIEPGATIEGSVVESPSVALGTIDVDAALRARPGTGPAAQIEFKHLKQPKEHLIPTNPSVERSQTSHQIHTSNQSHPRLRVVR